MTTTWGIGIIRPYLVVCRCKSYLITIPNTPPYQIILSGYPSPIYDDYLDEWREIELQAMTRGGPRTEKLWFNYEIDRYHWAGYAGKNRTDRQRINALKQEQDEEKNKQINKEVNQPSSKKPEWDKDGNPINKKKKKNQTRKSKKALPGSDIGLNTTIEMAYLWVMSALSLPKIQALFQAFKALPFSTAGISKIMIRLSDILQPVYEEILNDVKRGARI